MKSFKLTENGDISITDGVIDMAEGTELEKQTIKTVLGTNKGEWAFDENEGIDFKQILGKGVTADMVRSQVQSGIYQVNPNRIIEDFDYSVEGRKSSIGFIARETEGDAITVNKSLN
jgi:hypothetical protein